MIVREIVNHRELIETFDFFNDYDDTIRWLSFDPVHRPLIEELKQRFEKWLAERQRSFRNANP